MDEMHFKRHGAIARVVKEIDAHDKENAMSQPKFEKKKVPMQKDEVEGSSGEGSTAESPDMSIVSSDYGFKVEILSTKQKKKERKKEKVAKQVREDPQSVSKEELDHVSEAIHLKIHGSKSGSFADSNGETTDDNLPYGEGICPQLVAENIFFTSHQRRKYYGNLQKRATMSVEETEETPTKSSNIPTPTPTSTKDSKKSKQLSPNTAEDALALIDPKILERLGVVGIIRHDTTRKRRELVNKLASLIKEDIDIVRKEDEDTRTRQASFWRFVGSSTLENLVESHKDYSWQTGELKNKEKYGDSLKVTGKSRMVDGIVVETVLENECEVKKSYGINETDVECFDAQGCPETKPSVVLQEHALGHIKEERRQKRLSSQEGFSGPVSKTRSRTKSQASPPRTPLRARNILKIIDTDKKKTPSPKPKQVVMRKSGAPVKKTKSTRFGTANIFDSLDDMEA